MVSFFCSTFSYAIQELLLPYCDIKSGSIEKDGSTVPQMQWCNSADGQEVIGVHVILDTLFETNISMQNGPFEDVFPVEYGQIPLLC